jgi:hypothetical protein
MTICVSLNEFIRVATGCIYEIAPYHKPRFIDEIVDEIIKRFKANCKSIGTDFFYHEVELKDLYKFIENILKPIDKFRDLNLSSREYAQGIDVDDPNRPKFQFVSAFDSIPEEDNFVDLDACIQNIFSEYEHGAYRQWLGYEIDTGKLSEFRKEYREAKNDK